MRTQKILLVIATTFMVGVFRLDAQTAPVIEKRIGNAVYELNTEGYTLRNKANKITNQEVGSGFVGSVDNSEQARQTWVEHFKPLFSKERAEELRVIIGIFSIIDSTGQVREVEMFFRNRETFEMFTPSEIQAIENTAKRYRYNVRWWSGEENGKSYLYTRIGHTLRPHVLYSENSR
jgi:hypothetical protein